MKIKTLPVQFKAGPPDGLKEREFLVYPATFIRQADSWGDVIAKGAFLDDIAERKAAGSVLSGLWAHRMDDPDFYVATGSEEGEDDHGWWVRGMFDESAKSESTYRLVKGRRVRKLSFAYDVLGEGQVELENGQKANELRKLRVHEFSFVPVGANRDTSVVAVKGAVDALTEFTRQLAAQTIQPGQLLAKDHIDSLRSAQEAIAAVITAAEGRQDQHDQHDPDQGKSSGTRPDKPDAGDETGPSGKSPADGEDPSGNPSDAYLAEQLRLYALIGAERGRS